MKAFFKYAIWFSAAACSCNVFASMLLPPPGYTHHHSEFHLPQPKQTHFINPHPPVAPQAAQAAQGEVILHAPPPKVSGQAILQPPPLPPSFVSLEHPFYPIEQRRIHLPGPRHTRLTPLKITLRDAILLALRHSPVVKTSELQRVTDKYALALAHYAFEPQYTFNINGNFAFGTPATYAGQFQTRVKTPIGTEVTFNMASAFQRGTNVATVSVMQPILRGGGAVNLIPWKNAIDQEEVAKLGFKNNVITVVVSVVQDYRQLVQDYNNLKIQERTLKDSGVQVKQAKLRYEAGKMSKSDLIQVSTNYETTRLDVVTQENTIQTDYQQLLSTIGLVPSAHLQIYKTIDYDRYKVPPMQRAIEIALHNNISYQSAVINLRADQRAVVLAKDARRWQLNATGTVSVSDAGGMFLPATSDGGTTRSVMFQLNIPVDDFQAKVGLVNAKIALEQAKLNLEQQKEDLIRDVINQVNTLENQLEQIAIAKKAVSMQAQNLRNAELKLKYGKTTVFEVNGIRDILLQQEINLVATKIAYLNGITQLYQTLGITLDEWDIKLRY